MKSDNFEWLMPSPVQGESWRWGRYAGPLQVEFSPGTITWVTESLVNPEVGQRVLVRFYSGTRATIMGVLGGKKESWRWGTVMAVNPVRVRLDGDSEPLLDTPGCLVPVTVGDRVRVQVTSEGVTVFGKLYAGTQGHPGEIVINGTAYPTSGVVDSPGWTVARTDGNIYTGNLDVSPPFTPPTGWTFTWSVQNSSGYTFIATSARAPVAGGTQRLRVMQVGANSTTALKELAWHLTKL